MLNIVKLTEDLKAKLQQETEVLISDRLMTRDVLAARMRELANKRDEEHRRIEQWAQQQKALVSEVFGALIGEAEEDAKRNEANLALLKGEAAPAPSNVAKLPPKPARHLKAAE